MKAFGLIRIAAGALVMASLFAGATASEAAQHYPWVQAPAGQPPARAASTRPTYHLDPAYRRQTVRYDSAQPPGTIIVDTKHNFLFLQLDNGRSLRYGIGSARPGFGWEGTHTITDKREWPDWTPPPQMLRRQPDLPRHMQGGLDNPLGARALYIGHTLYRIHGTNQPWTIGQHLSSGCIRMLNRDVIDLYGRVKIGAKVIVL